MALLSEILKMFIEMGPYILLGLFFVGLMNLFVTKSMIEKHIGKNNYWSIFKSAFLGVPLPLCSCGVIPTAVYMTNNNASKPAVISFLISTPQTGVDSIIATYGMMGPVFAIFRPLAALIMGFIGGISSKFYLDKQNSQKKDEIDKIESSNKFKLKLNVVETKPINKAETENKPQSFYKKFIHYPYIEFLDDIAPQFIVGVIIAGLISYFIPDNYFSEMDLNSGFLGMLLMIIIGIPMYICATASIPIALALLLKGFSPGVAFVFLAVGPATNAASLSILIKALGKKIVSIYLITIILTSILLGYFLDFIFNFIEIDIMSQLPTHHHHSEDIFDNTLFVFFSILLFVLLLGSIYRLYLKNYLQRFSSNKSDIENGYTIINVSGMTCNHCEMTVENAINKIDGVLESKADHTKSSVRIKGDFDKNIVEEAINKSGYDIK